MELFISNLMKLRYNSLTNYRYQVIAKEILREELFARRIDCIHKKDDRGYVLALNAMEKETTKINAVIRDIAFDYFNIIPKEYEVNFDKWKND